MIIFKGHAITEALLGVLEYRRKRAFISGEQGNKGQIMSGTGEKRQYWEQGKQDFFFDLGGHGNKPIYFRATKEQAPVL